MLMIPINFLKSLYSLAFQPSNSALEEWVKMGGFDENRIIAKKLIYAFLASDSSLLDLGHLNLSSLPDMFNDPLFNQLQSLVLEKNRLKALPNSLIHLKGLEELNLAYNYLTELPDSFGELEGLKKLNVQNNQLTEWPEFFGQLKGLEELDLAYNYLTKLPDSFGELEGLKKLNVQNNQLTRLPELFGQLQALKELYLGRNELTTLPDSFGELEGLEELDLGYNLLTKLPDSFGQLKALRKLNLDENELRALPDFFGQLGGLETLWLVSNQLTTLPESFGQLQALKELYLGRNELTTLPDSFGQLKALKKLVFGFNKLTRLPASFCKLEALEEALLMQNQLITLPDSLGNLRALRKLGLHFNLHLSGIPHSIFQLSRFCEINLMGCGLSANILERLREATTADSYRGPRISYSMLNQRMAVDEKSIKESLNHLYTIIDQPPQTFTKLEESPELQSWLNRLTDTAGYKLSKSSRKSFAEKIIDYLNQANDDAEFRATFYRVIADASTTCGDRVTLSILHLSIAHKLATIDLKNMKNLANFLVKGPWTIEMLEAAACEKVNTLRFFDEVEVYLGYPIYLKDSLEIPIDVKEMLYFQCSALTKQDLEEAKSAILKDRNDPEKRLNFLVNHATWRKALELNYLQEYRAIVDRRDKSSAQEHPDYRIIEETFKQALQALTQKALST